MEKKANNLRRKHSKKGELDYQILITIANNGAQYVTSLKENIGRAKSTISKKLKKMDDRGSKKPVIIRVMSQSPTKKTRDKYFVLTEEGIEKLILGEYGEKISSKTFWKMMYYSFHKTSEQKMNTKLDYFLSLYAENILGFSTDYVQFYPAMNYELSDYYEKKHLGLDNKLGKAFDFIAYEKSFSKQRLEKIFGKEILSLFFKKRETEGRQLFTPIQLNQSRIELTIFGLLLLLRRLYDQARSKKLTEREVQNKIEIIRNNYGKLFPKIFDNWGELKELVEKECELLIYFRPLHSQVYFPSIHEGGIQELLDSLASMGQVYRQKIEREFDLATETILKLKTSNSFYDNFKRYTKNGIYRPPNLVVNHPLNHILNEYAILLNKKIRFGLDGFSEAEKTKILDKKEDSFADAASFRFYAYFFRPHGIINQDIAYSFLEENNLKDWYNAWLKEILRFQNQNIKSIEAILA